MNIKDEWQRPLDESGSFKNIPPKFSVEEFNLLQATIPVKLKQVSSSEKIESIPDERLERISKRYAVEGTPKYSGGDKYDDQWIYRHRGYGSEVKKHKLEVMMKAMNKDNQGFEEYDKR